MFLVDSHCHLDALDYEKHQTNIDAILHAAAESDVKHCLTVATTLSGFETLFNRVGKRADLSFSCGVHPLNLDDDALDRERFMMLAKNPAVVALGETGLDYYYQTENLQPQQAAFRAHIQIGNEVKKPIIVHTRAAQKDTLSLLREENVRDCGGVLHCFTEDKDFARKLLDLGLYISFSGIVTFKNAEQIRDAARYVPMDRLLVETDSPYLAPVPYRGKDNQPAYARATAEYLSVLKGIELTEFAQITTQNFSQLFNVSLPQRF